MPHTESELGELPHTESETQTDFETICNSYRYVLTSSLLLPGDDVAAKEEVIAFEFDSEWNKVLGPPVFRAVLPVAHSAAHRIAVAVVGGKRSLLVTGLLADVMYQFMPAGH